MFSNYFFFLENRGVYEIMWKNDVGRGRPQMTIWRMRIACWIPKATNTHKLRFCNTHSFSTAKIVARTRLNVTLYVHYLSCLCTQNDSRNNKFNSVASYTEHPV